MESEELVIGFVWGQDGELWLVQVEAQTTGLHSGASGSA